MTRRINREIYQLAIPNILSNVSVPLLSSVDTALMGHSESAAYIGAVGLGAMFFNMLYWAFSFLRMGTTGMTAQAYGQENPTRIAGTFARGIIVAILTAFVLLVLQIPLENISVYAMSADSNTAPLMQTYFSIRIWAAPAALALMVFMGWFFGMQNSLFPLILTLIINISNILLSVWWVRYQDWGISGVAWGTVVAQYIGLLVAIFLFIYKYKETNSTLLGLIRKNVLFKGAEFKRFFLVNRDIFLRTICIIIAFGFFYNRSSLMGITLLAVNQVFMQYINWMSYAIDGFAYAAESLIGKYEGAKNNIYKKATIRWTMIWGGILAVFFSLLFYLGDKHLLALFTNQAEVIQVGQDYLFWIILFPILGFASYIWDGIFVGLTASKAMRDTMFLSLIMFFLGYVFTREYGNNGLWFALSLYVTSRGILQMLWYKKRAVKT